MNSQYLQDGYHVARSFYRADELDALTRVVSVFHERWQKDNAEFYAQRAINSAYLTGKKYLSDDERLALFEFIGSHKFTNLISNFFEGVPAFLNTQLFFNPVNPSRKNYWHRDIQYDMSLEQQQEALGGAELLHFRIALEDEPGIELVPGTHQRWDTEEELDVRLEKNGHSNHEQLSSGKTVSLKRGDLLVFSGKMIHRGVYGKNRLAFDILLFDADLEIARHIDPDCLPDTEIINSLEDSRVFENAIKLLNRNNGDPEKYSE